MLLVMMSEMKMELKGEGLKQEVAMKDEGSLRRGQV